MEKQLQALLAKAKQTIHTINDQTILNNYQAEILGKNSVLNNLLKDLKNLDHEQRIKLGQLSNSIKNELQELIKIRRQTIAEQLYHQQLQQERINVTYPGYNLLYANQNPLYLVIEEISTIFTELGYQTIYGPEVETDEYNFQRLNLPVNHPVRDMQDTFYLNHKVLLRTHCTNVTARMISNMQSIDETIAVISAGNVFRRDGDDATHSHQFMQVDGFMVAPNLSFANLKWTMQYFCQRLFGKQVDMRLRPSYFPFTEPSVEIDISCLRCQKKGCNICKYTGYVEILGAGMINPAVYQLCHQPATLTGFAFGVGIERIAMLKYGIDDIRKFYVNDLNFLAQFPMFN